MLYCAEPERALGNGWVRYQLKGNDDLQNLRANYPYLTWKPYPA